MRMGVFAGIGFALAIGVAVPASATEDDVRSIAGMTGHSRVLLVFAPNLADPRLATQRRAYAHMGAEAASRDLELVQVAGATVIGAHDKADKLRRTFTVPEYAYRSLLIGKDGHVVIDRPGPIDEGTIRTTIDAMPMRQAEMHGARRD